MNFRTALAGLSGVAATGAGAAAVVFSDAFSALWLVGGALAVMGMETLSFGGGWRFWAADDWARTMTAGRIAATAVAWALAAASALVWLALLSAAATAGELESARAFIPDFDEWELGQMLAAIVAAGFAAAFAGARNGWAGLMVWGGVGFLCTGFAIAVENGAYPALDGLAEEAGDGLWALFAIPAGLGAAAFYIARRAWRNSGRLGGWAAAIVENGTELAQRTADAVSSRRRPGREGD